MAENFYVDIFATKGIEYLFVIGFLAVFVLFWRLLRSASERTAQPARALAGRTAWFSLLDGAYYHQGHAWAVPEGDGRTVRIGLDDFAQRLLGRASRLDIPQVGSELAQGAEGWRVGIGSKSIGVLSPVAGEIVAVNADALLRPDLVNDDPYGRGWLLKVRVTDMKSNLKNLLSGKLAVAWMEDAVATLRRKMVGDVGPVMQDGGLPVSGIARALSDEQWDDLAREFLLSD